MKTSIPTFEEILEQWATDSVVNENNAYTELLKIGKLHSKYIKYMAFHSLQSKMKLIEYNKLKNIKWDYYKGTLSREELEEKGWKPYLKSASTKESIERCLDMDDDLNNLLLSKSVNDEAVEACKLILKELNNRTWSLKSWVDYQKFLQGSN